jgi:hypothetical protein
MPVALIQKKRDYNNKVKKFGLCMPTPTNRAARTVPVVLSLGLACINNVSGLRVKDV